MSGKNDFDADHRLPSEVELSRAAKSFNVKALKKWKPMRSWPFCAHPEQARIDFYKSLPSAVI